MPIVLALSSPLHERKYGSLVHKCYQLSSFAHAALVIVGKAPKSELLTPLKPVYILPEPSIQMAMKRNKSVII